VPEWCEKGCRAEGQVLWLHREFKDGKGYNGVGYLLADTTAAWMVVETINKDVAALRDDRDRWREACGNNQDEFQELSTVVLDEAEKLGMWDEFATDKLTSDVVRRMAARIRELEAAQARQMVTIETLTAQLNEASKACEMWMTLAQPARKYPTVEQVNQWHGQWYRGFSAKVFSDWLRDRAREQEGKGL
jgi:hypothetical protein